MLDEVRGMNEPLWSERGVDYGNIEGKGGHVSPGVIQMCKLSRGR